MILYFMLFSRKQNVKCYFLQAKNSIYNQIFLSYFYIDEKYQNENLFRCFIQLRMKVKDNWFVIFIFINSLHLVVNSVSPFLKNQNIKMIYFEQ